MTTDPRREAAIAETALSRYELLYDDERFGLSAGDILICGPLNWAWPGEKVAVLRRESDGYEPGCTQYRVSVRHISGPRS